MKKVDNSLSDGCGCGASVPMTGGRRRLRMKGGRDGGSSRNRSGTFECVRSSTKTHRPMLAVSAACQLAGMGVERWARRRRLHFKLTALTRWLLGGIRLVLAVDIVAFGGDGRPALSRLRCAMPRASFRATKLHRIGNCNQIASWSTTANLFTASRPNVILDEMSN